MLAVSKSSHPLAASQTEKSSAGFAHNDGLNDPHKEMPFIQASYYTMST